MQKPTAGVPRIGRALDLAGLLTFLAGAGFYAWAWTGFQRVRAFQPSPDDPLWAAVRMADGYWRLQKIGVGLMAMGGVVFVLAWWTARRVSRPAPASEAPSARRTAGAPPRP